MGSCRPLPPSRQPKHYAALARKSLRRPPPGDIGTHSVMVRPAKDVTMVGRDILEGMTLSQRIEPTDYSHLIVACLSHDMATCVAF